MSDLPPTSPPTEEELPFERKPMVNWFHPEELARAGIKAVLSKLFGAYADNREIQALRPDLPGDASLSAQGEVQPTADYSGANSLWLDYVADLGDGWDSTYAIAQLLAAPTVEVDGVTTQRGRVLVMGGDQVYPTATKKEYQDRLEGPYRSALSFVDPKSASAPPPHLYAVPGNHDWYDGLTSFTRLFCQNRWIGAWKTRQSRSYFALKLPYNWWLWGIDVQLQSDIDAPQMYYFEELGKSIPEGAKIILCVAEPTWLSTHREGIEAYDNLSVFEERAIHANGHEHVVGLAGDLHAYARYRSEDGRLRFISGGGGAYLYPTHCLPDKLELPTAKPTKRTEETIEAFFLGRHGDSLGGRPTRPPPEGDAPGAGGERALYPPPGRSRTLALKSLYFAWYNRAFALFFGCYYLILAWLVESASKVRPRLDPLDAQAVTASSFLAETIKGGGPMLEELSAFLPHAPLAVGAVAVLAGGLIAFADAKRPWAKVALGSIHTAMHVVAFLGVTWLFMQVQFNWLGESLQGLGKRPGSPGHVILFAALMLGVGSAAAGVVWGLYLLGAHWLGRDTHSNEVLACQSIPHYKHILRLHITKEGLTIYPLGLEEVPNRWRYHPGMTDGEPWFTPDDGGRPVHERAVLIEPPVCVRPLAKRQMVR